MTSNKRWLLAGFALLYIFGAVQSKRNFKCPSGCSCSKETIICVGTSHIPRTIPNEINSLWVTILSPRLKQHWFFNKTQGNQCIHGLCASPQSWHCCVWYGVLKCACLTLICSSLSKQEHGKWIYRWNYRGNVFTYAFSAAAVSHVELPVIY